MAESIAVFNPVLLSLEENQFIIDHAGEPPIVASRSLLQYPGANPKAVMPHIQRVFELIQLTEHESLDWAGVDAIKNAARIYLDQAAKWKRDRDLRRSPRFPSMYSFDSKGRARLGGVGSDSGIVKTYFDKDGHRHEFAVEYIKESTPDWAPDWTKGAGSDQPLTGIKVDVEKARIECSVCNHTEKFDPESNNSLNLAKARMSKHLKTATVEVEAHHEVLQELL